MKTRSLVTGVTGQDGSYLVELLLSMGHEVHGIVRRSSTVTTDRISHLLDKVTLHCADLLDQECLTRLIGDVRPHEIYNLASQSFVAASWQQPVFTAEVTALGCLRLLEAIVTNKLVNTKFYQASTSEMFGQVTMSPQNENTPFHPRSPYGVAKCYAHYITQNYKESYGLFACSGIMFNHESPRRGIEFVTRKITNGVARIKVGLQKNLVLGSLDAKRDWGHARDYVEAMFQMLQQSEPRDLVIATNTSHSVEEFVAGAFTAVGLDYTRYVSISEELKRPAEVWSLRGDYSKAHETLGWKPTTNFEQLVQEMVLHDLVLANRRSKT